MKTLLSLRSRHRLDGKDQLPKVKGSFVCFNGQKPIKRPGKLLLLLIFLVSSVSLFAQPVVQWDKTIGGLGSDFLSKIVETKDGGFIVAGSSGSPVGFEKTEAIRGGYDYWMLKISKNGNREWDKTLGGTSTDFLYSVDETVGGGYSLAGTSSSGISGDKTVGAGGATGQWFIKTNSAREITSQNSIEPDGPDPAVNINVMKMTPDSGYILAGDRVFESPYSYPDGYLVKISKTGVVEWTKQNGYAGSFTCVEKTSDGGYIVGLDIGGFEQVYNQYVVYKLAADGTVQWTKKLGGENNGASKIKSVRQTMDGGYILGGTSNSGPSADKSEQSQGDDYWIVKLSGNGSTVEWEQTIQGESTESFTDLRQTADGGYIVLGNSESLMGFDKTEENKGPINLWVVKLSETGEVLWDKTIGGTVRETPATLITTGDGGFLVGGSSFSPAGGDKTDGNRGYDDIWIVKFAPDGGLPVTLTTFKATQEGGTALLNWQTTSETRSDRFEVQHSINGKSWDLLGTVNAKGESTDLRIYQFVHTNPALGENLYRLKMIDTDGTFAYSKINSLTFDANISVNVFPNPAAETLTLQVPDWSKVKGVEVIDSQGKSMYHSGMKPVQSINARGFSKGLYFVKISLTNGSNATRKIVIGH